MCRKQNSREEFCELRDELLFPPAGEVDHLLAASDVAADTRSLLLTAAAPLKHTASRKEAETFTVTFWSQRSVSYWVAGVFTRCSSVLMVNIKCSHQSSRAADLLFDVVHQETKDALVLFSSLVNATGRQLKHTHTPSQKHV